MNCTKGSSKSRVRMWIMFTGCVWLAGLGAQAATIIYEPFSDSESTLNGNTAGTGLSGTWVGDDANVTSPGSTYSTLSVSGNKVDFVGQGGGSIGVGSTLSDAGLLAHNETLWFSVVWTTGSTGGSNPDQAFALGTDALVRNKNNNVPMGGSGSGIGFTTKSDTDLRGANWTAGDGLVNRPTDGSEDLVLSTTYLIVGEIQWGVDEFANDTITLYLPGADLLQGTAVATHSAVLDQSLFDTISFSTKGAGGGIDEIRFGANYADVVSVPEPSVALLCGLAGLVMLRRRR